MTLETMVETNEVVIDQPILRQPTRRDRFDSCGGPSLRIVILGLSITSSWGNGHATTYRGLVSALVKAGHEVLFLERDLEWYAANRDLPDPPYGRTELYSSFAELKNRFADEIHSADCVILGSYVPEGAIIGKWVTQIAQGVTAFYDIDTPVTLAKLLSHEIDYLTRPLIQRYSLYLSFTGGPLLECLETRYGSPMARPLYCSVDPELYYPEKLQLKWDLGYMGTYSDDRQPTLERLLIQPARQWPKGRFAVAGPQYPARLIWPHNVRRFTHLPPDEHRSFYNSQRFTLNVTRAHMVQAGYSPSVRLFEAAACGIPIISDYWKGLETILVPGKEILVSNNARNTLEFLRDIPESQRLEIGQQARKRVLSQHTAQHRARELERYICAVLRKD